MIHGNTKHLSWAASFFPYSTKAARSRTHTQGEKSFENTTQNKEEEEEASNQNPSSWVENTTENTDTAALQHNSRWSDAAKQNSTK